MFTNYNLAVSTPVWVPNENILFVASAYGTGGRALKLSQSGGKNEVQELWKDPHLQLHFGTAILRRLHLYVGRLSGPPLMTAFEVKTGKIKWQRRGFKKAQLVWAGGKVILTDEDGMLALCRVSPAKFEVLSKASVLRSIAWDAAHAGWDHPLYPRPQDPGRIRSRQVGAILVSMTARWVILLAFTIGVFAQTKQRDACVPPPSGVAPALPAHLMTGQGDVHFPITTSNPKAQQFFDQGLNQLHSFWAGEAERSFRYAAELDPEAPMPWWGIAMVAAGDYRPRFQIDLIKEVAGGKIAPADERAIAAAERAVRLAEAPGKATDLEKLYIASVAARRNRSLADPDEGYISGLRAIIAKYPKEVEPKTYLALHLMRGYSLPDHKPRPGTMEAVELLRALLVEAPEHPGVHHYVIHGWEGSSFAKDAWPSCKRYAELVTNIPHALHMPGHIYSQTGKWDEAVKAFGDASENELGYIKADPMYGRGHHGHNVHYLATAYSFSGDYENAKKAALSLLEFKENPREAAQVDGYRNAYRQGWIALLGALVQGEKWDEILEGKTLPAYDRPRETAWRHWALGLAHAAKGQVKEARDEAALMDAALKDYTEKTKIRPPAELRVARAELDGQVAIAAGKVKSGLKKLAQASQDERRMTYAEPPLYPRPVAEAMGELALKHGKTKQAQAAFNTALEQYPESARSRAGLRAATDSSKPVVAGQ